jgi:hypothetical protein
VPRTPEEISHALGAGQPLPVRAEPHGPFGILRLQEELASRLQTRAGGGRPSDPERTIRRLVSFRPETWKTLTQMAFQLTTSDRRVSPGQVAATLVEESVAQLRGALDPDKKYISEEGRQQFLLALQQRKKVRVSFWQADGTVVTRLTAPLDLGPVRRERGHPVRYQFWDYEGKPPIG